MALKENFPYDNKKVVYEFTTVPLPVYINITYSITLKGEYFQQINEMLTPFITQTGQINSFYIRADGHKFEAFLPQDFAQNNNVATLGDSERTFETKIDIRVLGYLMGADKNDERPRVSFRENAVEVRIPREHVIFEIFQPLCLERFIESKYGLCSMPYYLLREAITSKIL